MMKVTLQSRLEKAEKKAGYHSTAFLRKSVSKMSAEELKECICENTTEERLDMIIREAAQR